MGKKRVFLPPTSAKHTYPRSVVPRGRGTRNKMTDSSEEARKEAQKRLAHTYMTMSVLQRAANGDAQDLTVREELGAPRALLSHRCCTIVVKMFLATSKPLPPLLNHCKEMF